MKKKVHYFSFYIREDMEDGRQVYPAALTKVEYVKNTIKKTGKKLTIVSTALAKEGAGYLKGKHIKVDENETHYYLPTFRYKNWIINKISTLYMYLMIIWYVLINVEKEDDILIYHSLAYIRPFNLLRKIKRLNITLEFNDLYHVTDLRLINFQKKEIEFIKNANKYLFMNNLAEKQFSNRKPCIVSYGNYNKPKRVVQRFSDGKTHVVYAGIIENTRKAALLSAQSALYLNQNFQVHILGFGTDIEIKVFTELVEDINKKKGYEAVIYHGRLRGQELSNFLHSCHIGVSSHSYTELEMDSANYTFPSKIPTYIAHDLYVVSPDIPCVLQSPFKKYTTFYSLHKPIEIANAIKGVQLNEFDESPSQMICEMDQKFYEDIKKIFKL